jgi:MFS family permease
MLKSGTRPPDDITNSMLTADPSAESAKRGFYGWWIVVTSFITFGIAVGIPYYNQFFFYDYFQKAFHWELWQITLGFPLGALLTLWAGPLLIPHFSPRKLIIIGTGLTAVAFFGFSAMNGSIGIYYLLYFVYTVGYIFSGPIPHQILVSYWFQKKRGRAMGIVYVGVGLFGGLGSFFVRSVTAKYNFHTALMAVGGLMFLTWPLAILLLRDRPEEKGQLADGATTPPADAKLPPHTFWRLFRSGSFWLLLLGSICSIGSIGSINTHMKFVFRDAGFTDQKVLDATWTTASVLILWSSIAGRLSIGYFADVFSKKRVMVTTYFVVAVTILLLLFVSPSHEYSIYVFALVFGFSMGADYMLIPLMAAEQFGVNTLARAMAIILPVNTIGQTWFPFLVSKLREHYGNYLAPMAVVFGIAMVGAIAIAAIPKRAPVLEPAEVASERK